MKRIPFHPIRVFMAIMLLFTSLPSLAGESDGCERLSVEIPRAATVSDGGLQYELDVLNSAAQSDWSPLNLFGFKSKQRILFYLFAHSVRILKFDSRQSVSTLTNVQFDQAVYLSTRGLIEFLRLEDDTWPSTFMEKLTFTVMAQQLANSSGNMPPEMRLQDLRQSLREVLKSPNGFDQIRKSVARYFRANRSELTASANRALREYWQMDDEERALSRAQIEYRITARYRAANPTEVKKESSSILPWIIIAVLLASH